MKRARCGKKPYVRDPAKRFCKLHWDYVLDQYGPPAEEPGFDPNAWWDLYWHDIPFHVLENTFSRDELLRLWWSSFVDNKVNRQLLDHDPIGRILWKVQNSMWQWGYNRDDYNLFVDFCKGIQRFDMGPDFEVRLDFTRGYNERGHAAGHYDVWIDGVLGFFVYFRGKHVLTIGFSPTSKGVLIQQVQLRQKKGNRWLFKLDKPYLALVVERMAAAFGGSFRRQRAPGRRRSRCEGRAA